MRPLNCDELVELVTAYLDGLTAGIADFFGRAQAHL